MDEPTPNNTDRSSFVRWQGITITQFGYAVNLILGLSTASLGFSLKFLTDEDFKPQYFEKVFFDAAILSLGASLCFGIFCVINRLRDFRETTRIARDRRNPELETTVTQRRELVRKLGKRTWCLFYLQLATFSLGLLALVLVFASMYRSKLF